MVVFQALTWESRDVEGEHLVSIFGRTEDGKSVCVTTPFKPYFFIKLPDTNVHAIYKDYRAYAESYELLKSKDVWGFQNNEKFPFMKLNFRSLENMRKCDSKLRRSLLKVYESNVDPVLRLMHRTGIQSTGWLETGECDRAHLARTDIDLYCSNWRDLKPVERDDIAPFIVASFDIETHSSTGKFPDPCIDEDAVFQIAIALRKEGKYDKTCLCYKKTAPVEGANIVCFESEKDLLMGFSAFLKTTDIDILTGWNIFGFDLEYICKRAAKNNCPLEFYELGKLLDVRTEDMVYKRLSSSALGDNMLKLLPMSGRYIFDLFHEVKREKKLDSYSLNFVSETFLGDKKIDMPPKEMFKRFVEGDPQKLSEVAEYCIKDTLLPHYLMDKLCTLLNLLEMAKATWVPLCYLSERGQQIKVFSQITRKARELGYMVPTIRWGKIEPQQYEGATVLEAVKGAYYVPITALDFEGLYPSIMMAHNLCYSTLVIDEKYANVPGVNYESFEIDGKTYKFAQDVPSLLPAILDELKQFRKQAKRDMARSTGQMKQVYNGKQLAYKVSMNSVYGFTGASRGILPCVPIAATTTAEGRHMIEQTKELVEREFRGAKVRYGDSVTPDTPLLVKINGRVMTKRIDDIVDSYVQRDDGKEIGTVDAEVWTERGFTAIRRVVRHKTLKKMFRVVTHTGLADVTEDHSLLRPDATMVKPSELAIGTELLHSDNTDALGNHDTSVSQEEAEVMGFFFGDGSCPHLQKSMWNLNNSDKTVLEHSPFETDTMESSGVSAKGCVKSVVDRYSKMMYNKHRQKIVPACILNAPVEIAKAFWNGYYKADGDKNHNYRFDNKGKEGTMGLELLSRKIGFNTSLNTRESKPDIFRVTCSMENHKRPSVNIKKIVELPTTDDYVYDLTTDNHHFHVGPGNLVVHNTDSVMVEFDCEGRTGMEALEHSWALGERAAEMCNKLFKPPKNLELEKVYWPYILYSKKRYAAKMWTQNKEGKMAMDYIDVKGLQLVRRDNIPYVRQVSKEILDIILESKNSEAAKKLAHERAVELLSGKVPMEKLILSQKLADNYKSTSLPHVRVRDKIKEREPGSEPQSGDRVQFVLLTTGDKQFEKAEDPRWVEKHALPLDYQYYFTNKFMNPVCDLLEPLVDDPKQTIFGDLLPKKKPRGKSKKIEDLFEQYESSRKDRGSD